MHSRCEPMADPKYAQTERHKNWVSYSRLDTQSTQPSSYMYYSDNRGHCSNTITVCSQPGSLFWCKHVNVKTCSQPQPQHPFSTSEHFKNSEIPRFWIMSPSSLCASPLPSGIWQRPTLRNHWIQSGKTPATAKPCTTPFFLPLTDVNRRLHYLPNFIGFPSGKEFNLRSHSSSLNVCTTQLHNTLIDPTSCFWSVRSSILLW